MSEVAEKLNEAVEKAHESKLNTVIAMCVAVVATFMALCNVKASNVVQQMSKEQANAVDQWSYFQSKSTKIMTARGGRMSAIVLICRWR